MFTGIIEEIGTIAKLVKNEGGLRIFVTAPRSIKELNINDSVAINGVCQTVISKQRSEFEVEAVEETLKKTNLRLLKVNDRVNIELPMKLTDRLGGHLVQGHVDCVGQISDIKERNNSWIFSIVFPEAFSKYTVSVGSIAVDGVSLTIARLEKNRLDVSIIPHTMENTIFKLYQQNNYVNLEFDIIGKYVEGLINKKSGDVITLNEQSLRKLGF